LPGNEKKLAFCKKLGADVCINYKTQDFVKRVKEEMGGQGIFSTIKTLLFPIFYKGAAHVFNEIGLLLIIYFKKNIKIDMLVLFFVK
jgi:NADPH:quinone reductase-like Zn-dependent oxidoreductase